MKQKWIVLGFLLLIALAGYEAVPFWAIFGGVGIEIEEHENLAVFRLGTEYEFFFKSDWLIAPGVMFDYKVDFLYLNLNTHSIIFIYT